MKKILSLAMAILIAFQTFSFVTPNARAETDFPRPAFPDGPEHTNELVDVINANTTNVLIVTEGYGPLTGVSPITEKDFWVDVLADMTGDFDVDWYDGVPSSGLLNSYDLVIYDAGGYWYPLSGGVTEPLEDYHFSVKPLIVVAPDINYDWQGPVPGFCNDVLHIEGVLGILPEAVYDIYADTGHDIIHRTPKDVGIGIPAVTSWPDCFDPKADCDSVLRQGYIPATEFGVGTCSGLPQYSPYDPAGTLFSVVAYPGSETEGRAVTYGVPIAGLENTKIAEQLAEDSIRWCLEEKLIDIDLTLYIEDAVKGKDENAVPIVNKAPGDKIDIVANVFNSEKDMYNIDVVFEVSTDLSLNKGFIRNNAEDTAETSITATKSGNKYTVTTSLDAGKNRQIVLRFDISTSAPTTVCPVVTAEVAVGGKVCNSAVTSYNMVSSAKAAFVTNRHLLYSKYDVQQVSALLRYVYKISDWREQNCIVYYLDHQDESLEDWDQSVDYTSGENTANVEANKVDDLIEVWMNKLAKKTYWGPILISTEYPYVVIIGSDETVPFYRKTISGYTEEHYGSDDPALHAYDHDYFFTDMKYADMDDSKWDQGAIDLCTSRIVGASAEDMRKLIENGLKSPADSNNAIVGTAWAESTFTDGIKKLRDKKGLNILNDGIPAGETPTTFDSVNWGSDDLVGLMKKGGVIFEHSVHGDYYVLHCSGTTNMGTLKGGSIESYDELTDSDVVKAISSSRMYFVTDSCHTGLITDEDGSAWNASPEDNLAWAIINDGSSGYLAVTSYGWNGYSDKLHGIYYNYLLSSATPSQRTKPVGDSLRHAVKSYTPQWWIVWGNLDKVAVTDPILYGIPWMTIDPPVSSSPQEGNKDITIDVSKPEGIGVNTFKVTVDISVLDYSILKVDEFDLININGAEEIRADGYPILPKAEITMKLPRSANILDLALRGSDSTPIGNLNIPCFESLRKESEDAGLVSSTGFAGAFPVPLFGSQVSDFDDYRELVLSSGLAQWDSETGEATLYNHLTLELTYQSLLPLVVTDFAPTKTEYDSGEPISTSITVMNIASEILSPLDYILDLKDCHGQVQSSVVSQLFDLEPGETRTFSVTLPQEVAHGTYLLEVTITGSGTLGVSHEYVQIQSGEISHFTAPPKVKLGDDITFQVSFTNSKQVGVSGEFMIYLYNSLSNEIAQLYSSQMILPANSITQTQITWNTAGKECDTYLASAMVCAGDESFGPVYLMFAIVPPDEIAPTTVMQVGTPNYTSGGVIYVTSVTPFTLSAEDNLGGTGVDSTFYRTYNSSYDTGWLEYSAPFYLAGLSDGEYSIDYYSTDNIGNTEPTNPTTVILDNTAPTATLTIGEPKYIFDKTYVTPDTPFTLEAADIGSGIFSTAYRICNATYDSGWITYAGPVYLTSLTSGAYTFEYNSTDNVQNTETTHTTTVTLFHWNYVYQDTSGRGTTLKINLAHKFFQFTAPSKDYGIRKATSMRQCGRAIIINHSDKQLRLITASVDTKTDFCFATAWDLKTRKQYLLIDKAGIE